MIDKKKILVIAPLCLPITGAEAIVNAKLLSALSIDGRFEIDLISKVVKTGPYPRGANYKEFNISLNNLAQIEVDNVINYKTILGHLEAYFKFGTATKGSHWAPKALKVAEKWVKNNNYDYVLSKSFPSLLVAYYIKRKYGVKWVATWNDPFPDVKYPYPYGKGQDAHLNHMEQRMLDIMTKYPDVHIFPSDRLRRYMLSYLKVPIERTLVVPHVILPAKRQSKSVFDTLEMVHSGNLGRPRTPKYLLKALRVFLDKKPDAKIRLTIIGKIEKQDQDYISSLSLSNFVSCIEPVPYAESIKQLRKFNLSVIVEAPCQEGIFLPTKVADFMESEMPILALSPSKGTLNDLYNNKQIPYFAEVDDIEGIALEIDKIYNDFTTVGIRPSVSDKTFSYENIADIYFGI